MMAVINVGSAIANLSLSLRGFAVFYLEVFVLLWGSQICHLLRLFYRFDTL